jgi:anti-anti-sigma factor
MAATHPSEWLEREDCGGVTVLRLRLPPTLDDDTARAVFAPLFALVGEAGRTRLVVNLAAVGHPPSLALGKLVALGRKARAAGGRLALCQLSASAEDALEHTRLGPLFPTYATEQEAVRSFS